MLAEARLRAKRLLRTHDVLQQMRTFWNGFARWHYGQRPAAVERGVGVGDGNSHSPKLTSLGAESHGHVANAVVILADLPPVSRCEFIYGDGATLPVVVIVDNNESAGDYAHGKVFEDTLG